MTIHERFRKIARSVSSAIGTPYAFVAAFLFCLVWGVSGPMFGYSDTWQLVINTSTTVMTFLIVFLIQNTQNHDSKVLHLKIDELIRSIKEARNGLLDLENLPDEEISRLEKEFHRLHNRSRRRNTESRAG
ncbi:MAG: low affinity iron permease family protein [Kofleriaceae bacterium]|nr:low affinity iron permease family protein [Kofleriaceae bacterium]